MPDEPDTPLPLPLPPLSDREILERIEQWLARIARSGGSQALTVKQFADGTREELGQLHGGLLVLDGGMGRLERNQHTIARHMGIDLRDRQAAGGEGETHEPRDRTPTDKFDLVAGVTLAVPKRRLQRWLMTWKGIKVLWYVGLGLLTLGGWGLHLWRLLARH